MGSFHFQFSMHIVEALNYQLKSLDVSILPLSIFKYTSFQCCAKCGH